MMTALRGATTVENDTPDEIRMRTLELYDRLMEANTLEPERIISVVFSVTEDIQSAYPGMFLRLERGLTETALMHFNEMKVTGSLQKCIRIMIHYEGKTPKAMVYLHGATILRPDLKG
ncbi:MAG TPA: chorismate mutase [Clostridiaceae bacterium]|nr:chorismate mutase [Clostridiaceae bacterium]